MEKRIWSELVPDGRAFHISRNLKARRQPIAYHGHDFAELCWVESGKGIHHVNGTSYEMSQGDLVLIRPFDCHGFDPLEGDVLNLVNVGFTKATWRRLGECYCPEGGLWFWTEADLPELIHLDASQKGELENEFDQLSRSPRDLLSIDGFCLNLIRLLRRTDGVGEGALLPEWLDRAMREFALSGSGKRLEDFFRLTSRSPEHVARVMRQYCEKTPSEWVNEVRIRHAANLLEASRLPIIEIAFECGFQNQSYFHRLFLKAFEQTPFQYRKRHQRLL
jgi:AraC family transcriptional regulator, dual regulator of chb operon